MYEEIRKALLSNADGILDAIDKYLAKADKDLEGTLGEEGYVETKETVAAVNALEEEIADALYEQTDSLLETLQEAENDGADAEELKKRITAFLETDDISERVEEVTIDVYDTYIPVFANSYIEETDGDLVVDNLRHRTWEWIIDFGRISGAWQQTSTHESILKLVKDTIDSGTSIADLTRKIQEGGWRNEYYQARRYALTETLRAHSVAHEEAIQQSPACDDKEWRHTGGSKNTPRPNHVAMDGQIVPKSEPFELKGRDGAIYYPMYPRDSILPASESVNCHCIHRGIVNQDILGYSYEERKQMQQDYINADNESWQQEKDAENKAKAGIYTDEQENSKPKYSNKATVVDRKQISSADYRKRYNELPETKMIQRKVASNAKKMLRHRSGTEYEDLAFIDSRTGAVMFRDDYNKTKTVIPSRSMKKMIKQADDYTIIAIHNHPTSSVPSLADLTSAKEKRYKYGIVVGHDGSIYKYAVSQDFNKAIADGGLDMLERVKYTNDEEKRSKMLDRALSILSESGVEMEVL